MTPRKRALIGALVGAVLTLVLHPASRPLTVGAIPPVREASLLLDPLGPRSIRPQPESLEEAAVWVHAGAQKAQGGLHKGEVSSLIRICDAAAKRDADNAFWLQMKAAFCMLNGDKAQARAAWVRASNRLSWRDYQSTLFSRSKLSLEAQGIRGAWTATNYYYRRSDRAAAMIERYARGILTQTSMTSRSDLVLRFRTLQNGSLLRDGSQSLRVGSLGASIVDYASYPRGLPTKGSPKRMILAQLAFTRALRENDMANEAEIAFKKFRGNDGWRWLRSVSEPEQQAEQEGMEALAVATALPGALATSLFGLLIWAVCALLSRKLAPNSPIRWAFLVPVALILGGLAWWASGSEVLVGLVLAASVAFTGFSPEAARTGTVRGLGPLFSFVIGLLAITLSVGLVALAACWNIAGRTLIPMLFMVDPLRESAPDLLGVILLVAALVCVLATLWAYAQRVSTAFVLVSAFQRIGATMAAVSLVLFILGTPFLVKFDQQLNVRLTQLMTNEPVYYLVQ